MPIHTVVRGIQLATYEPFPEGRIIGVQRRMPILVPAQHVGVLAETFRVLFLAEAIDDVGIAQIGLANKLRGRIVVFLFPPMNCDLGLAGFDDLLFLTNFRHENYPFSLGSILLSIGKTAASAMACLVESAG